MSIFINTLKRLLKSKVQIAVLFIIPLIPIIPTALNSSGTMGTINIGIVNNDNTRFTSAFIKDLSSKCNVTKIDKKDIKSSLDNAKVDYAIVIPKGYTNEIINLKSSQIIGYEKKGKECSKIVGGIITSFISPVKNIAKISQKNSNIFYNSISKIPKIKINKSSKKDNSVLWGLIIQFVMFSSIFTSSIILTDRENKTFFRSLNAPISLKNYMLQTILSFMVISIIQVLVLSLVSALGCNVYAGKSLFNMLILLCVVSLVSVSFGVAISSIGKSATQATVAGIGIITLMCMIGGAWGMNPRSHSVKIAAKAIPVTWAMDAVKKLVANKSLYAIGQDIIILLMFSIVFFLLGTWKKTDITK